MFLRSLFIMLMLLGIPAAGYARGNMTYASVWGYTGGFQGSGGGYEEFILDGAVGQGKWGKKYGTADDEGGVTGVIAEKVVQHGGYFCAYHIQCANKKKEIQTWNTYHIPNGGKNCVWLCEAGYSGTDCATETSRFTPLDKIPVNTKTADQNNTEYKNNIKGRFNGISINSKAGQESADGITEFEYQQYDNGNKAVLLGLIKFAQHGAIVSPLITRCGRYNWKHNDSCMIGLETAGTPKLLCASGYKPNESNTDCIEFEEGMEKLQNTQNCTNFDKTKYDPAQHDTMFTSGDNACLYFMCRDTTKAFRSADDTTCVTCSDTIQGGQSTVTGLCKKCNAGQYFDQDSDECKTATAYSKTDVMYGKDKTKNTQDFKEQCWPLVQQEDFSYCIREGGKTAGEKKKKADAAAASAQGNNSTPPTRIPQES